MAVTTSHFLNKYQYDLDRAFNRFAPSFNPIGGVRQINESRLGSIAYMKAEGGESIALRIYSDTEPGYMRAFAFDQYDSPNWKNSTTTISHKGTSIDSDEHIKRFALPALSSQPIFSDELVMREVWPHKSIGTTLYTQLQMPFMEADAGALRVDAHGSVTGERIYAGAPYRNYAFRLRRAYSGGENRDGLWSERLACHERGC